MTDSELIRLASDFRVFAVMRGQSAESAVRAAEAAIVGGIKLIQVSLATPGSYRVISDLRRSYGDRAYIGASSVTTYEQVDRAIKSGAQYISMPHTSTQLIDLCRRYRIPSIIGALTPTEVASAASLGAALVNVFPAASLGGPEYFSGIAPRMPDFRLIAEGGVGAENIVDYFAAGAYAVAVGRRLFMAGDLQNSNYVAIAERARGLLRLAGMA
jgi:2-dehydro-3-deoxyphosphogluconate aldolase/(4S)-4-hydroxy-2-oxoglutarate aldolase